MKTFKSLVKKLKDPKIISGIAIVAVVIGISVWLIRRRKTQNTEGYTGAELACLNACKSAGPNHSPARTACRNRCKAGGGGISMSRSTCPVGMLWNVDSGTCQFPLKGGSSSHVATGWTVSSCASSGCRWDATTKKCAPGPGQTFSASLERCVPATGAPHMTAGGSSSHEGIEYTWGYCYAKGLDAVYSNGRVVGCKPKPNQTNGCRVACVRSGKCKAGNQSWNKGLCCDQPWSSREGCADVTGTPLNR